MTTTRHMTWTAARDLIRCEVVYDALGRGELSVVDSVERVPRGTTYRVLLVAVGIDGGDADDSLTVHSTAELRRVDGLTAWLEDGWHVDVRDAGGRLERRSGTGTGTLREALDRIGAV